MRVRRPPLSIQQRYSIPAGGCSSPCASDDELVGARRVEQRPGRVVAGRRGERDPLGVVGPADRQRPRRGLGQRRHLLALLRDPGVLRPDDEQLGGDEGDHDPGGDRRGPHAQAADPGGLPLAGGVEVDRRAPAAVADGARRRPRRRRIGRRQLRCAPVAADGCDERQRPLAELRRGRRPDGVANDRRRAAQPLELRGALRATGEVTGQRRRLGRVARGKPVEPVGFDRRKLEELPRLCVFHLPRHRS